LAGRHRDDLGGRLLGRCIRKWFAKRPRFHVHFTPTYGSWINLVERWFAELTNKRIRRGVFRSVKDVESAIREFIAVHNEDPTPFVWTRSADQILAGIARYAQHTLAAHSPALIARTTGTGDEDRGEVSAFTADRGTLSYGQT
jgi:DDE superfamily endonuclease